MAQSPSTDSAQYSALINLPGIQSAGSLVHIKNAGGEEILTFEPAKAYESLVISSPELAKGET
jgi:hypothetical protein